MLVTYQVLKEKTVKNKIHELLAPAGDYEKAIFALNFGADAIYIGPKQYSLRARSSNFDIEEICKITKYAHNINKKVYVVLNIFCHNVHLKNFENYFKEISNCKVDGIICADPFIIKKIHEIDPKMEIHISTQQSITNSKAALFWKRQNASRVVLAREVDYNNLKSIVDVLDGKLEVEYFIHGAVCIAYSGRCTMSNNFSFRDANIGGCAHSCRWAYNISNCPGINDQFTMSAKDMNLSTEIDKLLELKIHSFKIEGRMKSIHYVATIVSAYRKLLDGYSLNKKIDPNFFIEIKKAENRITDLACFDDNPTFNKMLYLEDEKQANQSFVFIVKEKISEGEYRIILKNVLKVNELLESMSWQNESYKFIIDEIIEGDIPIKIAFKPMFEYIIKINHSIKLNPLDLVRKITD